MRVCLLLAATALSAPTAGCSSSPEHTTSQPASAEAHVAPAGIENSAPGQPPATIPPCPTATELAIAHVEAELAKRDPSYTPGSSHTTADSFEASREQPDLDGDGTIDLVLVGSGYRNVDHYFFVDRAGCHQLVGVISTSELFGFYCSDTRTNGLCDLGVSRLMIHGETEHSDYKFDGTTYQLFGTPELGPRKDKFNKP